MFYYCPPYFFMFLYFFAFCFLCILKCLSSVLSPFLYDLYSIFALAACSYISSSLKLLVSMPTIMSLHDSMLSCPVTPFHHWQSWFHITLVSGHSTMQCTMSSNSLHVLHLFKSLLPILKR